MENVKMDIQITLFIISIILIPILLRLIYNKSKPKDIDSILPSNNYFSPLYKYSYSVVHSKIVVQEKLNDNWTILNQFVLGENIVTTMMKTEIKPKNKDKSIEVPKEISDELRKG